jgi:hypothetical protein
MRPKGGVLECLLTLLLPLLQLPVAMAASHNSHPHTVGLFEAGATTCTARETSVEM